MYIYVEKDKCINFEEESKEAYKLLVKQVTDYIDRSKWMWGDYNCLLEIMALVTDMSFVSIYYQSFADDTVLKDNNIEDIIYVKRNLKVR